MFLFYLNRVITTAHGCAHRIRDGIQWIETQVCQERTRWVLWMPMALSLGISSYFNLSFEPPLSWMIFLGAMIGVAFCAIFYAQGLVRFMGWGLVWAFMGFGLSFFHTLRMQGPAILAHSRGPLWLEGHVTSLNHLASSQRLFQRIVLTLSPQTIQKKALPQRVSLSIRTLSTPLEEGDVIGIRAKLNPLPSPCFPGGYDPQRYAFFQGIGASGFALSPPQLKSSCPSYCGPWRHALTRTLLKRLSHPFGAIACALTTGDKLAIPQAIQKDFSASGLSHLLAISGLHLSLLSGMSFFFFRRLLACIPYLALTFNLEACSAMLSLGIGALYLMLSGYRIPTQRAFLMMTATVMAMMLSRKKQAMRILSLCACLLLCIEPEVLMHIDFQLSFSAVAGLLAFYEAKRRVDPQQPSFIPKKGLQKTLWDYGKNSLGSTALITFVTLPIVAFHFQQISLQSFFTNLMAIPFTACIVLPFGVLALLSLATPFAAFFFLMWEFALFGLCWIAKQSSFWLSFLVFHHPPLSHFFFAGTLISAFWMLLWKRPWRWLGVLPWGVFGILGYGLGQRPAFLMDAHHVLSGYLDYKSRTLWVSSLRKEKWITRRWALVYGMDHIRSMAYAPPWMISSLGTLQQKAQHYGFGHPLAFSKEFILLSPHAMTKRPWMPQVMDTIPSP